MNRCQFVKQLSSYLDNQLSEAEKTKIEAHLKECSICARELANLKLLSEKLKLWHQPELGKDFEVSVKNQLVLEELEKGEVKMKRNFWQVAIPSGVLASILVFLFVNVLVNKHMTKLLLNTSDKVPGRVNISELDRRHEAYYLDKAASGVTLQGDRQSYKSSYFSVDNKTAVRSVMPERSNVPDYGPVIIVEPRLPATGEEEKIIRTAEVTLEVEDAKETYAKALEICKEFGGYLASSNFYKDKENRESGKITMRIPKDKFLTALDQLSLLGKVETSSTDSQDVSQEYANLETQLKIAMVAYDKMMEAIQKRQVTPEQALRLESEITPILRRIEAIKNQIENLHNQVSFTTVNLTFHEPKVSAKILEETKKEIHQSILATSINTIKFVASVIPVLLVGVIILVVLMVLAFVVKFLIVRLFKKE